MKTAKTMYGLEYKSYDGACTFDILETFRGAEKFAGQVKKLGFQYAPLYIFKAEFNPERVYMEDGSWNYDDCSDTFASDKKIILKQY